MLCTTLIAAALLMVAGTAQAEFSMPETVALVREIGARCHLEMDADKAGAPIGRAACDAYLWIDQSNAERCTAEMKQTGAADGACSIFADRVQRAARMLP